MEQIGVEPIALLAQIVNFSLIVFLLTKILYKPILKTLDERKKKIEEGLAYTEEMKKRIEENDAAVKEILTKAREDAREIIEEGKKTGKKVEAEIIDEAHLEAKQIIEKGHKDLDLEKTKMEKQLIIQTIEIAKGIATKALEQVLSEKDQKSIIDRKIKEIAKLAKL
ncbi:ATP synthase F0 subunit B [Candidatus Gottesmanbacteria bacterium RBG_13_37_7]|uniref:ATP synthase subunit b n=1 Tax=Candidatus Gottesmanbacteria bacterium RBG_13_37_7 TaxID=1798369 RepID=A0A1F5YJ78_9BACT|nr:MAG: ATP synthase F0 subunit B [Candidatus Gottesmanbacteria bacterium RBG_13_37_7]